MRDALGLSHKRMGMAAQHQVDAAYLPGQFAVVDLGILVVIAQVREADDKLASFLFPQLRHHLGSPPQGILVPGIAVEPGDDQAGMGAAIVGNGIGARIGMQDGEADDICGPYQGRQRHQAQPNQSSRRRKVFEASRQQKKEASPLPWSYCLFPGFPENDKIPLYWRVFEYGRYGPTQKHL
jgi:hypothetical protein